MISGIYLLKFKGTDKVYVGQSLDIYLRYRIHKTTLNTGKGSLKLQGAYNLYGMPTLEILLECSKEELNSAEREAILIFDSVNNGFNSINEATHRSELRGELAGNSKYSNELVEEVFMYLVSNNMTHKEIEEITSMSRGAIVDISSGVSHRWLQEKYPDQYSIMLSYKGTGRKLNKLTAERMGRVYPPITSPTGEVYEVVSLRGFCREHNLNHGCIGEILRGHKKQYKGWHLDSVSI